VSTVLIDPNGKKGQEPIQVDFRIFGTPGHFTVGDIIVLGLDLAITEQDDFSSFLAQNNNSVKALTAELKQRAARVRAGGDLTGK
jgi:phospholipid transport system substrate-binding protein